MDSALRIVYDEIKYKRATPIQEKNT